MSTQKSPQRRRHPGLLLPVLVAAIAASSGCEVSSFFNPSVTGRMERMPTTIPVLERIDVIETDASPWGQATGVTPEDLEATDLATVLSPGDLVTVQVYELYQPTVWHATSSRIDAGGFYRVPELGDVQAAGMTAQEFEDRLTELLDERVLPDPLVDVIVESSTGLRYTLYGAVQGPGMYALQSPDLRLVDALAIAGGVPLTTRRIFVIRQINLSDSMEPSYRRDAAPRMPGDPGTGEDVNIEELIDQLEGGGTPPQPALFRQEGDPLVDVDDLIPARQPSEPDRPRQPPLDTGQDETFIFDAQRGEWVPVRSVGTVQSVLEEPDRAAQPVVVERIIQVPFQALKRGDNSFNLVVRPGDRIYVEEAPQGVVYLDGTVFRPGVYNLPQSGQLTLSRLIAAAGGLGPLSIPERVDLTRVVGHNREATIRLNLRAIRNRTEPDVILKADDHVILGTNFWAVPLAIIRSGFRATYGFGFLLDRNFGNDVFGAPPSNFND